MRDRGGSRNPLTGRSYPGDVPGLPDNGSRALSHHAGHLGRGYAIEPDAKELPRLRGRLAGTGIATRRRDADLRRQPRYAIGAEVSLVDVPLGDEQDLGPGRVLT